jgi:xanthine dehydrogenase YagS FAD-binding subunit
MKNFQMKLPASVEDAVKLLPRDEGDESVRLLAGGMDLVTELKEHLVEPETLVNLKSIPGLAGLEWGRDGSLTIGALTTLAVLAEDARLRKDMRLLAEAAESVGSPQIRAAGTLGGNLNQRPRCWYYRSEHMLCLKKGGTECFSYYGRNKYNAILGGGPSYIVHPSDVAPALVALGATAVVVGPGGRRDVPFGEYFTLPSAGNMLRETQLAPNEILTHVQVPAPAPGMRSTYLKFKERGSYDFALAAVAACLWMDGDEIREARLVLGGVAPIPWRVERTERKLKGRALDEDAIVLARESALEGAEPLSENGFKVPLTKGLVTRALERLAAK